MIIIMMMMIFRHKIVGMIIYRLKKMTRYFSRLWNLEKSKNKQELIRYNRILKVWMMMFKLNTTIIIYSKNG